jgi:hypothetical protein
MRLPIKFLIQDHSQIFYLIRHLQFSTKKSRIIKTPNLSVIRKQDHCCLVCVNRQIYLSTPVFDAVYGTLHVNTKRTYELAFLQQNHIISVALRLLMCIIEPTKLAVHHHILQQSRHYCGHRQFTNPDTDTASSDLNSNASTAKHGINTHFWHQLIQKLL